MFQKFTYIDQDLKVRTKTIYNSQKTGKKTFMAQNMLILGGMTPKTQ